MGVITPILITSHVSKESEQSDLAQGDILFRKAISSSRRFARKTYQGRHKQVRITGGVGGFRWSGVRIRYQLGSVLPAPCADRGGVGVLQGKIVWGHSSIAAVFSSKITGSICHLCFLNTVPSKTKLVPALIHASSPDSTKENQGVSDRKNSTGQDFSPQSLHSVPPSFCMN